MITCRTASYINQKNVEVILSIPQDLWEIIEKSEEWRRILFAEDLTIPPTKESLLQSIASTLERIEQILQLQNSSITEITDCNTDDLVKKDIDKGKFKSVVS